MGELLSKQRKSSLEEATKAPCRSVAAVVGGGGARGSELLCRFHRKYNGNMLQGFSA